MPPWLAQAVRDSSANRRKAWQTSETVGELDSSVATDHGASLAPRGALRKAEQVASGSAGARQRPSPAR